MTLSEARIKRGLTHKDIAQILNINENSYLRYEHYKVKPNIIIGLIIAEILHENAEELFKPEYYK